MIADKERKEFISRITQIISRTQATILTNRKTQEILKETNLKLEKAIPELEELKKRFIDSQEHGIEDFDEADKEWLEKIRLKMPE